MELELDSLAAREISLRLARLAKDYFDSGEHGRGQVLIEEAQEVCRRAGPPSPEVAAQGAETFTSIYQQMHQDEEIPIPVTPKAAEAQTGYMIGAVLAGINEELAEKKAAILAEIESRPLEPVPSFSETNWSGWRARSMGLMDRIANYPYSIPGVGRVVVEQPRDGGSPIILARSKGELRRAVAQGAELVEK